MRTLHIVSHTHWDREWYQTFQHFRIRLVHLLDNVLALLAEDDGYRYFMLDGQTIVLEDYLAVRPERAAEITAHIQSGRLLIGPWYVLPDEFLVSPEALVRNLLQGDRLCAPYGRKMAVGYIPDPFGHIGQMPQILAGFGIQTAAVMRGLSDEPCEFWWQAPDGTVVFMAYLRDGYGNAAGLPVKDRDRFCDELIRLSDSLGEHSAAKNLLLMFGTDHMEPPAETSAAIGYAQGCLQGVEIVHSTLPAYLDAVQAELAAKGALLPVVTGELRSPKRSPLLPGVLSTRMWIKQRNHACETLLERWAEPFAAWASLVSGEFPRPIYQEAPRLQSPGALLRQAWRILLTCHPHDSICGCSIDQVHTEMRPRFDEVEQIGEIITGQSLQEVADAMDTSCDPNWAAQAICVFNPLPGERTDLVELMLDLPQGVSRFEIVDQYDQPQLHQTEGLGSQEILSAVLSPAEFLALTVNVQDGRVAGMVMKKIDIVWQGDTVTIRVSLSDQGEPDREAFQKALQDLTLLSKNPAIHHFAVQAHSADRVRLRFIASHVPGPGAQAFWLVPLPAEPKEPVKLNTLARAALPLISRLSQNPLLSGTVEKINALQAAQSRAAKKPYKIQNEFLSVEADPQSGTLKLLDKRSNQLFDGLNQFVDGGDCGDEYNYCPPAEDLLCSQTRLKRVEIETSPVGQQMTLELALVVPQKLASNRRQRSQAQTTLSIRVTLSLWAGVARLEIQSEVDNQAEDHRLRVHFPTPLQTGEAVYDGHYGLVSRKIGLPAYDMNWIEQPRPEAPARHFSGLFAGRYGLVLAARGLPEVEASKPGLEPGSGAGLALTLLRCVGWLSRDDLANRKGHAGPGMPTPGAQEPGKHRFEYALIPTFEDPNAGFELGRDFQAPLRAAATGLHTGKLSGSQYLVRVSPLQINYPGQFILTAVKQAESGRGLVMRGYLEGEQSAQFRLIPWRRFGQVDLLRLDETVIGSLRPDTDGSVVFSANPHEVVTVMFGETARG